MLRNKWGTFVVAAGIVLVIFLVLAWYHTSGVPGILIDAGKDMSGECWTLLGSCR